MRKLGRIARWSARGAAGLLVALVASCGARTELDLPEPCAPGEETRPCANACGTGLSSCVGGYWRACEVRRTTRECENQCGAGIAECTDGRFRECQVEPRTGPCETVCGEGERTCSDGAWGNCRVPDKTRSCQDDCGWGQETCSDGKWSVCQVPRFATFCQSVCGGGEEICENGVWAPCNAPQPKPPKLRAVVRDFDDDHPDFEMPQTGDQSETGIVAYDLGADDKPVYAAGTGRTRSTNGSVYFDQWYRDVEGVNLSSPLALDLSTAQNDASMFVYDNRQFFPIDDQLLGNEGRAHNFHFTLEASTRFQYVGGEVFRFQGDDDMWVFINRRLAIDLGGTHTSKRSSVDLDQRASELGLVPGETYPLHFFFAERHTSQSNFTIETSIAEPGSCE